LAASGWCTFVVFISILSISHEQNLFFSIGIGLNPYRFCANKESGKVELCRQKIDATNYELRFTAQIDPSWHIYTTDHKGDIGVATSFIINANPLTTAVGKVSTTAKAVSMKDPSTGTNVKFYTGQVVFTQKIKLKAPVKTNITGNLEFMACDDKQCLAPTTKAFNIDLQ
jgi:thiol:disulfide interchange protein DsbD